MKSYLALDPQLPLSATAAYARRAERLGFAGLHVPETVHDSLAVSMLALEHTSNLIVRSAITLAFVRSPTTLGYAAWDLSVFSGGRFELGLGTQVKQNIEDRYGMPWSEPIARMGEYIGALRALFETFGTGRPLRFDGQHYRLSRMQPYFNPGPSDVAPPPIWLGAVNARMCELAGATADGVISHSTSADPDYLREVVRPALDRGGAGAGRPVGAVPIVAAPPIATGNTDADVARERERHRRLLAFLYSTPSYATTLRRRGRAELRDELATLIRADRWDDLPGVLDDTLLDQVVISGRFDELPRLLHSAFDGIAAGIVFPPLGDAADDERIASCLQRLAAG